MTPVSAFSLKTSIPNVSLNLANYFDSTITAECKNLICGGKR